jgi:hypothetical protein
LPIWEFLLLHRSDFYVTLGLFFAQVSLYTLDSVGELGAISLVFEQVAGNGIA